MFKKVVAWWHNGSTSSIASSQLQGPQLDLELRLLSEFCMLFLGLCGFAQDFLVFFNLPISRWTS